MSSVDAPPARRRFPLVGRGAAGRWVTGAVLISVLVLVLVLVAGGGAPQAVPSGLPDPGAFTGWALPMSRLLADLAGFVVVGLYLSAGVLVPSPAERLCAVSRRGLRLASRAAAMWFVAVVAEVVLTVSDILGVPVGSLGSTQVFSFVTEIPQGRALVIQALMIAVTAFLGLFVLTTRGATLLATGALLALVPPALTGHSAASGSHELAVASLLVHVLAAATWVGGLAALLHAAASGVSLRFAIGRFSMLAGWCFVIVAVSGVVNAAVRLGALAPLVQSSYGVLVLAKTAALLVLGGFGWAHRRRTVDQLEEAGGPRQLGLFVRVAAAEVTVMAATVGLAVGLSRTPTPVGTDRRLSAAEDLLGFPLPAAPSPSRLLLGWTPDGFSLAFVVFAGALYLVGLLTMRRHGHAWPVGRTISWYLALLVIAWATCGGLGLYSHVLFSAHMVAHMLLSMVAPIGLVLGAPITLALRTLPGRRTPDETGLRQLLVAFLHSGPVRLLTHPLVAFALWVGSLYALYFTSLFSSLMSNHLGHSAMTFHFLAVGSLFFWVLVGVDPAPRRWHPLARIGLLLVAMPFHAFFSITVMSEKTVLASDYFRTLHRPYLRDLLVDQHLGGSITWALSELPIILVVGAIFVQWVRSDHREATRLDRRAARAAADGAEGGELASYNVFLAALNSKAPLSPPDSNSEGTAS